MAVRMCQYVSRLLDRWEQQHRHDRHPPLILPVVLYHGAQGPWTAPRRVEELLDIPLEEARREGWLQHLLRLEYVLYDLMTHSEQELKTLACPPLVRLALVLLRLAITRQLVERMGGRLEVESVPGRGSIFGITLPLLAPAAQSETEPEPCFDAFIIGGDADAMAPLAEAAIAKALHASSSSK